MQSLSFADTPDYAGLRLQLEGALLAETRAVDGERAAEAERAAHAERGREAERAAAAQVKLFVYIYFLIEYLANIYYYYSQAARERDLARALPRSVTDAPTLHAGDLGASASVALRQWARDASRPAAQLLPSEVAALVRTSRAWDDAAALGVEGSGAEGGFDLFAAPLHGDAAAGLRVQLVAHRLELLHAHYQGVERERRAREATACRTPSLNAGASLPTIQSFVKRSNGKRPRSE